MLKKIFIENFKSCRNVEIGDLSDLMIFVGKNGAGKTNIFRAVAWAAGQVKTGLLDLEEMPSMQKCSVRLEILLDGKEIVYQVKVRSDLVHEEDSNPEIKNYVDETLFVRLRSGNEDLIFQRADGRVRVGADGREFQIGDEAMASAAILALLPDHVVAPIVREFQGFLKTISYNPLDMRTTERTRRYVQRQEFVKWQKTSTVLDGSMSETEFKLLDLKMKDSDRFDRLVEVLEHLGIIRAFTIDAFPPESDQTEPYFYFFNWVPGSNESHQQMSWADLSYGTRRLIRMFVEFFYNGDKVFMLEQPEDGIHTGLLVQVLPMLRKHARGRQVFINTHSADVMNAASPEEIRMVQLRSGITVVRPLDESEIEGACKYLKNDGPLSRYIKLIEE
ncbi:AAA family ATPase [Delftia acidovorans]|uniref:AAA family ATPase n=1 Tax=Delftia acidovorans TaxID=80866 RepID=UPI0030176384